jgi:prophage regulatory protein
MNTEQQKEQQKPAIKWLRLKAVHQLTALGRSTIYSLPTFPQAVRVPGGRCVAWIESEVLDWMQMAMEARKLPKPPLLRELNELGRRNCPEQQFDA